MKPPAEIGIGPYSYKVGFDEQFLNRDSIDNGTNHLFGMVRHLDERIILNPRQTPGMLRDTLLHEILHVLCVPLGMAGDDEERLVSTLSPQLLDLLRRNPKVVRFLTEVDA